MSDSSERRAAEIVETVLMLPEADRTAVAEKACGDDADLLRRVMSLLSAGPAAGGFMDAPTVDAPAMTTAVMAERPGTVIGRYKLLQQIGEGGFGVVFMAEQERPVRRTVAIKVIKLGMDTREVVARFEAERQALAMMDHPNIARVLDAGGTDTGRPYFVMELVRGSPITDYADRNKLTPAQRVALVAQVCRAVQHAHSKGVIHRDLKPNNVLVTTADDGTPVPKVIDFGIAKATQSKLTDKTLFTAFRQMIGTPQYMSPEQADSDGTDVDTRTDVYSLGVVLYELLTGTTPFDAKELRSAAFDAMRKIIREVEPSKPSTKLVGLGETAATVATNRGTDPKHLGQTVRGELDWIVMRALEKDRGRRYDTAAALADDLNRYLAGEAVVAGPPGGMYQLRKLARRYRRSLAAAAVVAVLVAAGAVGTTAGFVKERTTRQEGQAFAYRASISAAAIALRTGDGPRFSHEMAAAPVEYRGWEWNWLDRAGTVRDRRRLDCDPNERITYVAPPTDDRVGGESTNGTVLVWDLPSGRILWRRSGRGMVVSLVGGVGSIICPDDSLEVVDLETGRTRWRATMPSGPAGPFKPAVTTRSFSLDGSLLAVGHLDQPGVTVFDVATSRATQFETDSAATPQFLVEGPGIRTDGSTPDPRGRLYCGGQANEDYTWDLTPAVTDSRRRKVLRAIESGGWAFAGTSEFAAGVARGSGLVAVMPRHGTYDLYVPARGGVVQTILPPPLGIRSSTAGERDFAVADLPVVALRVTPDESRFVTLLQDGSAWVVPVDPVRQASAIGEARALALSPDGSRLVTVGWGYASCFDPLTGLILWGRNLGVQFCNTAAWSPDGTRVMVTATGESGTGRAEAYLLDGATGRPIEVWTGSTELADGRHPRGPAPWAGVEAGLMFAPDGKSLRVGHPDGSVSKVDATTWQIVAENAAVASDSADPMLGRHRANRGVLLPAPNGDRYAQVVLGGDPRMPLRTAVAVRNTADDRPIFVDRLDGHVGYAACWTPSGKGLAIGYSGVADACVRLVDSGTGKQLWRSPVPDGSVVTDLTATPDGTRVVAFTPSLTVVYDAETGRLILAVKADQTPENVAITPDGSLLVGAAQGSWGKSMVRFDATDPETHAADLRRTWPVGLPLPASVADGRRQVVAADAILRRTPGEPPSPDDTAAAPLVAAMAKTVEPNINWCNSWTLDVLDDPKSTPARRAAAWASLRAAAAAVPRSLKIQFILGKSLFDDGKQAESLGPLTAAAELYAQVYKDRSAGLELYRALAAKAAGDPSADEVYLRASDLAEHAADPDRSLAELRGKARAAFGH